MSPSRGGDAHLLVGVAEAAGDKRVTEPEIVFGGTIVGDIGTTSRCPCPRPPPGRGSSPSRRTTACGGTIAPAALTLSVTSSSAPMNARLAARLRRPARTLGGKPNRAVRSRSGQSSSPWPHRSFSRCVSRVHHTHDPQRSTHKFSSFLTSCDLPPQTGAATGWSATVAAAGPS